MMFVGCRGRSLYMRLDGECEGGKERGGGEEREGGDVSK